MRRKVQPLIIHLAFGLVLRSAFAQQSATSEPFNFRTLDGKEYSQAPPTSKRTLLPWQKPAGQVLSFTTTDQVKYENARVVRISPKGLEVIHGSTVENLPWVRLPSHIREVFGYDAEMFLDWELFERCMNLRIQRWNQAGYRDAAIIYGKIVSKREDGVLVQCERRHPRTAAEAIKRAPGRQWIPEGVVLLQNYHDFTASIVGDPVAVVGIAVDARNPHRVFREDR